MSKLKRNVAKPKAKPATEWTPSLQTQEFAAVAVREAKLELLDKLVSTFISLVNDIKAVV